METESHNVILMDDNKNNYSISIPPEVVEKLDLWKNPDLKLTVVDNKIVIEIVK